MSGARALASARRRRAEPQNTPPPVPVSSMKKQASQNFINDSVDQPNNSLPTTKMTPATMLLSHHKIIENLQKVIENQETTIQTQGETISKLKAEMKQVSKSVMDELNEKLSTSSLDEGNIEYYKEKLVSIEESLTEMKKSFLRVQTFAMETNIQSVELKKRMKAMETGIKEKDNGLSDKMIENTDHIVEILLGISKKIVEEEVEEVEEQEVEETAEIEEKQQEVGEAVEEEQEEQEEVEEQEVEEQEEVEEEQKEVEEEQEEVEENEMSEDLSNISNEIVSSKDILIEDVEPNVELNDTMTLNIE